MKYSKPSSIQRLHSGVFVAAVSALAVASFAYVTEDAKAEVLTDGYFSNADKHIPDVSVIKVISLPNAKTVDVFEAVVRRVDRKPTKKNPANFTYEVSPIEALGDSSDTSELEAKVKALEDQVAVLVAANTGDVPPAGDGPASDAKKAAS